MHEDQIEHWKKSRLTIHLLVQMSVNGKHTATALIRIDLGSRVKSLMERLEVLRGDRSLENTFVVTDRHYDPAGRRTPIEKFE
uniref:Uncharacterized protein n=1 Tax=Caenorhabditis japonica TaxID=281687 RepID=A0A8R1IVE1_CAEJA